LHAVIRRNGCSHSGVCWLVCYLLFVVVKVLGDGRCLRPEGGGAIEGTHSPPGGRFLPVAIHKLPLVDAD